MDNDDDYEIVYVSLQDFWWVDNFVTPAVVFILYMCIATVVMAYTGLIDLNIVEKENKLAVAKALSTHIDFSILRQNVYSIPSKLAKLHKMINALHEPQKSYYAAHFDTLFYAILMIIGFSILFVSVILILSQFINVNYTYYAIRNLKNFKNKIEISSKLYEKKDEKIFKSHIKLINELNSIADKTFWLFFDENEFVPINLALKDLNVIMRDEHDYKIISEIFKFQKVLIDIIAHNKRTKKF